MRKMRKGFTLVELLIVIAILGALSAAMTTSTQKATGLAKAQAIVDNINACRTAAILYYSENRDADLSSTNASAFLTSTYIPNWEDFTTGGIKFSAGSGTKFEGWDIAVDFESDGDAEGIKTALEKIRGYSSSTATTEINKKKFNVTLATGTVKAYAAANGSTNTNTTDTNTNFNDPDI